MPYFEPERKALVCIITVKMFALHPSGSLFRDLGPCRDLFDHLGPYFPQLRLTYASKVIRDKPVCLEFAFNV